MRRCTSPAVSLRSYIGAPPRAIRHTSPMPCPVLRDAATGAGHASASMRGIDVVEAAVRVDVGAREHAPRSASRRRRRAAIQPRDVRVLRLAHDRARRRVIEVVGIVLARVRRIEHQRHRGGRGRVAEEGRTRSRPPRCGLDACAARAIARDAPRAWLALTRQRIVQVTGRQPARRDLRSTPARSVRHFAIACGQRGWKWQPDGGASGDGISPLIGTNFRLPGSTLPTSASSACVYGWFGAREELGGGPGFDDAAEVHDDDAIADVLDHAEVVADEEIREVQRRPRAP